MTDLDALQAEAEAAKTDLDGPAWMRFWDHLTEDTIIGLVERLRAAEASLGKERRRGDAHMRSDHETGQHNMQLLARIARVEALHTPRSVQVITGDCALGECEHEETDECPTVPFKQCVACDEMADSINTYYAEEQARITAWPCPTVRALTEGEPSE